MSKVTRYRIKCMQHFYLEQYKSVRKQRLNEFIDERVKMRNIKIRL